jgi:hypothetical protein
VSTAERHARLTQLFGEAIELADAAERAALIARVRGEDPALGAELAELLELDSKATLATAVVPADVLDDLREQATPNLPVVAGYRIDRLLGEGGMGTVYAAEQEQPRRRVAIKILHARSAAALARFQIEADVMAKLDHPGIARVLEAGEASGRPFLAMEYVDGTALDEHVAHLPLRARRCLRARRDPLRAVCERDAVRRAPYAAARADARDHRNAADPTRQAHARATRRPRSDRRHRAREGTRTALCIGRGVRR